MTSTTAAPTASTGTRETSRRTRVLLGFAVLVVIVAGAVVSVGNASRGGRLDPDNAGADGARAVARVLDERGVEVSVARGQAAYLRTPVDASTAVVVSNAAALGASTLRALRAHARSSSAVILIGPSSTLALRLGLPDPGDAAPAVRGRLEPRCDLALFRGVLAEVPPSPAFPGPGCFSESGGGGGGSSGVLFRRAPADPAVQLVSDGALISNERVLDADNAAVALRLLGQRPRLVWYVANPADTRASDAVSVVRLLPRWLVPGLWLLALVVGAYLLVRGRRLGPLVREPLPVVVRATESTESRGRLYRRTRDRDHAARVLRRATRRRLATALSLPRDADPATLVVAVAGTTGRDRDEVGLLLDDRPVPDDSALADLGRGLLLIESEVRRP